jgi:hypothetical protein
MLSVWPVFSERRSAGLLEPPEPTHLKVVYNRFTGLNEFAPLDEE